jgi:hypothetical protein
MPLPIYPTDQDVLLDPCGSWPLSIHRFDADTAAALRAAEAAGRPLLLRGAPGTGKSQTARAAAAAAGRLFLPVVIDGRSEAQELQWHYDAVGRLSDAHTPGTQALDAVHYLTPGPLWWAYDWAGAERQWGLRRQGDRPQPPPGWTPEHGAVLLIDEIDKADPDLPNAFLEARCHTEVLKAAARLVSSDRARARERKRYVPGLAEYLDLVIALATLHEREAEQQALLEQTAGFVLDKAAPFDPWANP